MSSSPRRSMYYSQLRHHLPIKVHKLEVGETTQSLRCLLYQHEVPSSEPSVLFLLHASPSFPLLLKSWTHGVCCNPNTLGWSDSSMVKRVQFLVPTLGTSQLPVTPVAGDSAPSSGLCGYYTHVCAFLLPPHTHNLKKIKKPYNTNNSKFFPNPGLHSAWNVRHDVSVAMGDIAANMAWSSWQVRVPSTPSS